MQVTPSYSATVVDTDPVHEGELSFVQDAGIGAFRVRAIGFWSIQQVDAHFIALAKAIAERRRAGKPVHAFVDLSEAAVQAPEIAAKVHAATTSIYRKGDKVAVIVSSILAKAQMRRVLDPDICELFTSRPAAESWLRSLH